MSKVFLRIIQMLNLLHGKHIVFLETFLWPFYGHFFIRSEVLFLFFTLAPVVSVLKDKRKMQRHHTYELQCKTKYITLQNCL